MKAAGWIVAGAMALIWVGWYAWYVWVIYALVIALVVTLRALAGAMTWPGWN